MENPTPQTDAHSSCTPFPFTQEVHGNRITFYQTAGLLVYPIREVKSSEGETWLVSLDGLQDALPNDVDETIAFYFSMEELTGSTDEQLRKDIQYSYE